ncbi:MAG: dynamin family protein [Marmoricola sp.]
MSTPASPGSSGSAAAPGARDTAGPPAEMLHTLVRLHEELTTARLPLELPEVVEARGTRAAMVSQLEDYVLPRLIQIDAPLLTVVGGSTGAGKSTLVNALVGERVSESGVLRPTTRSPVLVHNPADAAWFDESRILPDFERTSRASGDPGALQLVASTSVPEGLAVLDAPDVDSVEQRNRQLAAQLLAAADMWLFVTSAARYADQVPWDFLKQAVERSAAVAMVLDRTVPVAVEEVRAHLERMMRSRGLRDSPLFTVEECELDEGDMLPASAAEEIRTWLQHLAADADARSGVVRQTLDGAIRSIAARAQTVSDACASQEKAVDGLRSDVDLCYERAAAAVDDACEDGTMLRGEVLNRWQEFVGTSDLFRGLEEKVSWARDRVLRAVRGRPQSASGVSVAVESGLQLLILEHAESAAERTDSAWRASASGRALLEQAEADLSRASRELRARAERTVRDWQQGVLDMVREEGADKRSTARFLAYGVNGLAVALMMVVFASTAGLTGAEIGIAGGSAVVGQKLLEAVFGDQAVRRLARRAREDLQERVATLFGQEQERFLALLEDCAVDPGTADRLRESARRVDDERLREAAP